MGNVGYQKTLTTQPAPILQVHQTESTVTATVQQQNPNLPTNAQFGYTTSLGHNARGTYLAVGDKDGAVYIFKKIGDTWVFKQKISRQTYGLHHLHLLDYFGYSVSLNGDYLTVGAYGGGGHSGSDTGAVYIFKLTGESWRGKRSLEPTAGGLRSK